MGVYLDRKRSGDKSVWAKYAAPVAAALVASAALVAEHVYQAAAMADASARAADARAALDRIEEGGQEQTAALVAAQADAEKARRERQRMEVAIGEVAALVVELDPTLSAQEALDLIADELRELHERTEDLEGELTGLRTYIDVAELNALGVPGHVGAGLSWSSSLSRILEGTWNNREGRLHLRCDRASLQKLTAATESYSTFPFSHYGLSECAFRAGSGTWREHADRALAILRHTTQIAGRHPNHDEVYQLLQRQMRTRTAQE